MNATLRSHSILIMNRAIHAVLPDEAVFRALKGKHFSGRVILVAAGKAAWQMAKAAHDCLGSRIERGIVITKYGHVNGPIADFTCLEGGHPIPDENSFRATRSAVDLVRGLSAQDTVLFLLSGGGSALFEDPLVPSDELQDITAQLLSCGADITEINTIRKRLSAVKGGRFAALCAPARVFSVILSDVLGDPLDMIASGPTAVDRSTCTQALAIAEKYRLRLSAHSQLLLQRETPKTLDNVETHITGSVRELCTAAEKACRALGYRTTILTDQLCCEAKDAGVYLASVAKQHADTTVPLAFLAGGETVVRLTGSGKGGRNQELALSAAEGISGLDNVVLFSFGSDGTDGPTDAAGGIVGGDTAADLSALGIEIADVLEKNDSYHALAAVDGLLFTGPTGTNVNDLAVVLIAPKQ